MNTGKRKILAIAAVAAAAVLLAAAGIAYYVYSLASTKIADHDARVYIVGANGPDALRDSLESALGEESAELIFKLWKGMGDGKTIFSGSYVVTPDDEAWEVARRIKNGLQTPVKVAFNNVRTIDDLTTRLAAQLMVGKPELDAAIDSILSAKGIKRVNYPAHFLPDTYEFYWNATPARVISKLTDQYDAFWTPERIRLAEAEGLTPEQVATLASIVEEETAKADERPTVARLYINRLQRGMKLQADPTVKFAVGDFTLRRILLKHLETESPFNTYLHFGLPPGPIRIPEQSTLKAVINAPKHDYLYMCAKPDFSGYHNFACDFATHNRNAVEYRNALNRRGIH